MSVERELTSGLNNDDDDDKIMIMITKIMIIMMTIIIINTSIKQWSFLLCGRI
jgi:hypothetical protein